MPKTKVSQLVKHYNQGDCLRACYATILGLSYDDVPDFASFSNDYSKTLLVWLEALGFSHAFVPWVPFRGYIIATVPSPNFNGAKHAVVFKDRKLFHDPGANGIEFTMDDVEGCEILIPHDPASK